MSDVTSQTPAPLSFGQRLVLAFVLPWKVFFDGTLAARVDQAQSGTSLQLPPTTEAPAADSATHEEIAGLKAKFDAEAESHRAAIATLEKELASTASKLEQSERRVTEQDAILAKRNDPDGALHLLRIFQRDGRLIDFLREDIAGFGDADIGGAARLVHEGCRKSLDEYFVLERVRSDEEGSALSIPSGFNAQEIRLTGNVSGDGPYNGTLAHAGWRASKTKLPSLPPDQDPNIIAPAEVEV